MDQIKDILSNLVDIEESQINEQPYTDLSHLTKEQVTDLISRYYGTGRVKDLIAEFNLNVQPGKLYKLFPAQEHPNYLCPNCGTVMVTNAVSKTRHSSLTVNDLYCTYCGHVNNPSKLCHCDFCEDSRIAAEERRIEALQRVHEEKQKKLILIKESYNDSANDSRSFESLTFRQKVYLGSICKAMLVENYDCKKQIQPFIEEDRTHPLAPNNNLLKLMVSELVANDILIVSSYSPLDAFVDDIDFPNSYYINRVWYIVNLEFDKDLDETFNKILNPTYYDESCKDIAFNMWREIAKAECFNYLSFRLNAVGFDTEFGKKTNLIIEELLNHFGVSQIYAIIWKEVASASMSYLEKKYNRNHAKNIAINGLERYGEKALANGWELQRYSRSKDVPQSIYSEFFFNKVLKIAELGFDIPPTVL